MLAYLSHPRVNCFLDDQISTLEEAVAKVQKEKADHSYMAICLKRKSVDYR